LASAQGIGGSFLRNLAVGLGALYGVLAIIPLGAQAQMVMGSALAVLVVGYVIGLRLPISGRWLTFLWILSVPATFVLLSGGLTLPVLGEVWSFAPTVDSGLWGGLLVTMLLSTAGIALSFPLGVLLALGRRSNLPVIKYFSITYIEVIRGVPLITLLFMAMAMLPLFLPAGTTSPPGLLRVLVAVTLFSAAYLAENVRGGLQALPKGQYEAADALGLSGIAKLRFIILPQALTKVIPGHRGAVYRPLQGHVAGVAGGAAGVGRRRQVGDTTAGMAGHARRRRQRGLHLCGVGFLHLQLWHELCQPQVGDTVGRGQAVILQTWILSESRFVLE
jgi:general L-amino acid transport system permease protein